MQPIVYTLADPGVREESMKLNASDAVDVLKTLIQEDRTENRIYRNRIQNVIYTLAVASFAISAFLIGKVPQIGTDQFRYVTLLIDLGLISAILIFFYRIKPDLVLLRKSMKGRQNLLNSLNEGEVKEIDPFQDFNEVIPDIKDSDLYWEVGLPIGIVIIKMSVLVIYTANFVFAK
jgi:hypothetical protein